MTTITAALPGDRPATNPFATRFTGRGRLPPLTACGGDVDLEELLLRFRGHRDRAAIRGPHGSGKSTLLVAMADRLRREGRLGGHVRLGRGRWRDLCAVARALLACERGLVVCIDSWERLGGCAAAIAVGFAMAADRGLLVTAHRKGWLPTLAACSTTRRLLARIVDRLPDRHGLVGDAEVEQVFEESRGNLREALFLLYDRFERARSPGDRS